MQAGETTTCSVSRLARFRDWLKRADAPVLVQEMRVRQRGIKPFGILLAYLLILSTVALLVMYFDEAPGGRTTVDHMSELGKQMFGFLSFFQLAMVALIVPAYSSASVSSERERGTFDLLALTMLSSAGIVTQKLVAAIGQAVMLIFASLPIMGVVFLLGGVSPGELLVAYSLLLVTAVLLGALGMMCSCCLRSSKGSTFLTYLIMFCVYAGLPLGSIWLESMSHSSPYSSGGTMPFLVFAVCFLFVGGVGAVLVYAPLALILHRKPIWRVRAFRMAIFGGVYAILLFIVTCPSACDALFNASRYGDVPLPLYVNPFAALGYYLDSHYGGSGLSISNWMLGATIAFSIGWTVVFRYISSARFAGLRRS